MSEVSPRLPADGAFAPTRWTLVLRARGGSPEARAALSDLCAAYYQPVFRFLCREGRDEDQARELTQEFFARLLAGGGVGAADPERGRFRSFLLGAVKHFLADMRERERRLKRGAGAVPLSLDAGTDTSPAIDVPAPQGLPADSHFDREWAVTLLQRAVNQLAREMVEAGKPEQFDRLKPWLLGDVAGFSQADTARELGLSEGAVKVAIHRLRRRFGELVRSDVAQTVDSPAQVAEELRYLVEVMTSASGG